MLAQSVPYSAFLILFAAAAALAQAPSARAVQPSDVPILSLPDAAPVPGPVTAPVDFGDPLYVIQPNDALEIYVYGQPELSRQVVVRPDGRISLPLVQDLQAAGLNPGELKQGIEASLKQYLEIANVTVIVSAIQSYQVYIMGQVVKPGVLTNHEPLTVLQALALAGGFQQFADKNKVLIMRKTENGSVRFPFDYEKVLKNENIEQNMLLQSGDVVVVP